MNELLASLHKYFLFGFESILYFFRFIDSTRLNRRIRCISWLSSRSAYFVPKWSSLDFNSANGTFLPFYFKLNPSPLHNNQMFAVLISTFSVNFEPKHKLRINWQKITVFHHFTSISSCPESICFIKFDFVFHMHFIFINFVIITSVSSTSSFSFRKKLNILLSILSFSRYGVQGDRSSLIVDRQVFTFLFVF